MIGMDAMTAPPTTSTEAKDPVCGMTVDPATTPHRHSHHGTDLFLLLRRLPHQVRRRPGKISRSGRARTGGADAGRHDLHLPDASRGAAGGPGLLPDLRHGAGAGNADAQSRAQPRTRRHDAPVLDRRVADAAGGRAGDGRTPVRLASAQPVAIELGAVGVRHAGGAVGRLAVLRARRAVARDAATSTCSP